VRHDTGMKRFVRGFMAKRWYLNIFNILYAMGALCLAGLGAYGAIEVSFCGLDEYILFRTNTNGLEPHRSLLQRRGEFLCLPLAVAGMSVRISLRGEELAMLFVAYAGFIRGILWPCCSFSPRWIFGVESWLYDDFFLGPSDTTQ